MYNLIRADFFKLRKSATIRILFGITGVCAVVMSVLAYLIAHGKISRSMTNIAFLFSDINVIGILSAVLAGFFICGDFDNKTINAAIAGGCGRGAVILSKAVVFFSAVAFLLLPYTAVTGVALGTGNSFDMGSIAAGYLHLLTSEAGKTLSAPQIGKLLAVMLVLIIVYIGQLSICVPLALAIKKPLVVVAVNYGIQILCGQLGVLSGSYPALKNILACTPYGGDYTFIALNTGAGDVFKAVAVSLLFGAAMLAVTYCAFRKTEIK